MAHIPHARNYRNTGKSCAQPDAFTSQPANTDTNNAGVWQMLIVLAVFIWGLVKFPGIMAAFVVGLIVMALVKRTN